MFGHVFISYSRSDQAYASELARYLTALGIPVWIDLHLGAGDRWDDLIRAKIDTCVAFVPIMSPEAEESAWVKREIVRAESLRKPIFPLLLRGDVFFRLAELQYEHVSGGRLPGERFARGLRALIGDDDPQQGESAAQPNAHALSVASPQVAPEAAVRTLTGHRGPVIALAASDSDTNLASAGADQIVRLWNPSEGSLLRSLTGHTKTIGALDFFGTYVFAGSDDRTIRGWDASSGLPTKTLIGHRNAITAISCIAITSRLASGSRDRTVRVWDVTNTEFVSLEYHKRDVLCVKFSPDGTLLASGAADSNVAIWDAGSGTLVRVIREHEDFIRAVAFSPDGTRIASASDDGVIRLFDVATASSGPIFKGHVGQVLDVQFSPDGRYLATGGRDLGVRIWRCETGELVKWFPAHVGPINALRYLYGGTMLATASDDGLIKIWSLHDTV